MTTTETADPDLLAIAQRIRRRCDQLNLEIGFSGAPKANAEHLTGIVGEIDALARIVARQAAGGDEIGQ